MPDTRELLRLYLKQRVELGERELHLDGISVSELERHIRRPEASGDLRLPDAFTERAAPAGATAPAATATGLIQIGALEELREVALGCPRCRLSESRQHVVFGEGAPDARIVVVGEAPGADEDRTGRPFVGRAGKLLDLLLRSVGLERESVYICNVLKCRPPGNRNPQPDEVEACSPYLRRQVELVGPEAIVALGTFAAQSLLGSTQSIGRLRGAVHQFGGVPVVPTYHPAALLRNPGWVRPAWEDLQRLRGLVSTS